MKTTTFVYIACAVIIVPAFTFQLGAWNAREADVAQIQPLRQQNGELQAELNVLAEVERILLCESGNNHDGVWGDKGLAYGAAQMHEVAYKELAERYGYVGGHWMNREDQIIILTEAVRRGEAKDYWACAKGEKS